MIGQLKGRIDRVDADALILDVNGVGYHVFCPSRLLAQKGEVGTALTLIIETHVREDHIHLYGFESLAERDWFRLLTTVQGVGVRMAMVILGLYAPVQLATILAAQDKKALTAVSGVGPKLAERMVTELKSKVAAMPTGNSGASAALIAEQKPPSDAAEDAVSALVNLGYGRSDAFTAVAKLATENAERSADELIRLGLKELSQ